MIDRLKQFVESEMRSCSMDIGGITPLYVYRMWGGSVAIEEIANGTDGTTDEWIHGEETMNKENTHRKMS